MPKLFSVIIPTYNRGDVVGEAIRSVLDQSFTDYEVVIVDDGSSDDTASAVASLLDDGRVQYHLKAHSGAADTRNWGVARSRGKFITFLDSDDLATPSWLDRFHEMINNGALVGSCAVRLVAPSETYLSYPEDKGPMFYNAIMKFTNGGSYFLRRDLFEAVGGFDPVLRAGQHTELGLRVAEYCHNEGIALDYIREPLVTIRRMRSDHIRNDDESVFQGARHFLRKHREKLELDKDSLYDYLSVVLVRGRHQPLAEVFGSAVELWKLRPFSLKTYLRLAKWLVVMRLVGSRRT
jgi:glycosyltransferase involved in cell wall biosynthesis